MSESTQLILVVDDEISDRERMQEILQGQSYAVIAAGDYDSAVDAFREHGDRVQLLVADISLPGKNGCDLAKKLIAIKPELRVLFVSGHVGLEVCKFYGLAPSDLHFLRKPFEAEEFVERIGQVLHAESHVPGLANAAGADSGDAG